MSSLLKSTRNTRALLPGSLRYIRSDAPLDLAQEDIDWLLDNDVRTLVDLRSAQEVEKRPCPLGKAQGFTYLHMPVTGGHLLPETPQEVPAAYLRMADGAMEHILSTIENAGTNVLFFCKAGKDRTGVVSALLLRRHGADDETIVRDYMQSLDNLRERLERHAQLSPGTNLEVILPCRAHIEGFLALLDARDGTKRKDA